MDQAQNRAKQGPVPTTTPTLVSYLAYRLREVVEPNLAPKTTERYAVAHPALPDSRSWLGDSTASKSVTSAPGSTGFQPPVGPAPRAKTPLCPYTAACCAHTNACRQAGPPATACNERRQPATCVRAALANAWTWSCFPGTGPARSCGTTLNSTEATPATGGPSRKPAPPLQLAWGDQDPLSHAAYAPLILGLRCGEALGLTWPDVNFSLPPPC